jgi:hypothetical protein
MDYQEFKKQVKKLQIESNIAWKPVEYLSTKIETWQQCAGKLELLVWHLDVIFSMVWKCPVVYLSIFDSTGSPITFQYLSESQVPITQDEHPISGLPSYFIHPCNTNQLLDGEHIESGRQLEFFLRIVEMQLKIPILEPAVSPFN